jgi:hypothetical protein
VSLVSREFAAGIQLLPISIETANGSPSPGGEGRGDGGRDTNLFFIIQLLLPISPAMPGTRYVQSPKIIASKTVRTADMFATNQDDLLV